MLRLLDFLRPSQLAHNEDECTANVLMLCFTPYTQKLIALLGGVSVLTKFNTLPELLEAISKANIECCEKANKLIEDNFVTSEREKTSDMFARILNSKT